MSDKENILERVRKLLALSKSSNANEAANAMAAANKLIDQHRLNSFEINVEKESEEDKVVKDDSFAYETGKVTAWRSTLLHFLASHYGCMVVNEPDRSETGRKVSRFVLVGRKVDMEVVRYMFDYCASECERLTLLEARNKGRVYASSYADGFVSGVNSKLRLSREEIKKLNQNSTALVKMDNLLQNTRSNISKVVPGIKFVTLGFQGSMNSDAFARGKIRGEKVNVK